MAEPILIPPIRTCLEDIESVKRSGRVDDPPRTDKSWYFYWQRSGEKLAGLVTSGTHANRPDPNDAPDGAFYTETDRGSVVYQNVNGAWQYVAGTMWGTLSPDQRPTGLGVNDAGFEYRSVDSNPALNGRDFLWSQSEWIEITPVRYDTHAARLAAPVASMWAGMLWVETDRGGATYQNQNGTWRYLSGTMFGTLSPDQRPTDLGVNDAGFDFRTSVPPAREFMWSQTAWVEITPVTGAINLTHPNVVTKVDSTTGQIVEGGITDLSAANSDRVHITAAGQVGIGTANAQALLHCAGGGTGGGTLWALFVDPNSGSGLASAGGMELGKYNGVAGVQAFTNTPLALQPAGGSVAIGTTTPVSRCSVTGPSSAAGAVGLMTLTTGTGSGSDEALWFGVHDGDYSYIQAVKPGTAVRNLLLNPSAGNVAVGMTGPTHAFQLGVDDAAKPGTNTWTVASDERVKRNIQPFEEGLATLLRLRPCTFEYNGENGLPDGMPGVGLVAQEAAEVIPSCVRRTPGRIAGAETELLSLNTSDLTWMILNALREIDRRIQLLEGAA